MDADENTSVEVNREGEKRFNSNAVASTCCCDSMEDQP